MQQWLKVSLYAILAAPLSVLTYDYLHDGAFLYGEVYYGDYVHITGRCAVWLLLLALAVTPLRLTFPGGKLSRWLLGQRRSIGVMSFAYAAAHLAAYIARQDADRVAEDFVQAAFWTGWLAFAIFAAMALTSNNFSMRLLKRGWKNLHRLVHVAAILIFLHWALTAFDPFLAYCHVGALALLEAYRLFLTYRSRHARAA